MGRNLYIADWHYDHGNCLHFDNRPFKTVEEMDSELIRRWNESVNDDDTVYILGDMFWCGVKAAIPVLDQLKGNKVLVVGNHDRCKDEEFRSKFVKIEEYMEVLDEDKHIVLSHYPIPCFKNQFHGWFHLYGHVHTSFEYNMMEHDKFLIKELYGKECNMFNVGAMMPYINYTPRTLDEILEANV